MKTWMITGCSTGLGRSFAKEALKQGYNVVVTARNIDKVKDIVEEYPKTALAITLDVTDYNSIYNAVKKVVEKFGTIDYLVNNAGYGYRAALEEGRKEDVDMLFETNVWGPVELMKAVLPFMRRQHSGAIINISSVAAFSTFAGSGYYAASKCALEALSEGLSKEVSPFGIKVMIVEPGAFRTDFAGRSLTESSIVINDYDKTSGQRRIGKDKTHGTQPGDPDKAAKLVIRAINSETPPSRLLLGKDAVKVANDFIASRQEEYNRWRVLSQTTDY